MLTFCASQCSLFMLILLGSGSLWVSVLFGFINFDQWCLAAALCIMVLVHEGCMHAIKADRVGLQCRGLVSMLHIYAIIQPAVLSCWHMLHVELLCVYPVSHHVTCCWVCVLCGPLHVDKKMCQCVSLCMPESLLIPLAPGI